MITLTRAIRICVVDHSVIKLTSAIQIRVVVDHSVIKLTRPIRICVVDHSVIKLTRANQIRVVVDHSVIKLTRAIRICVAANIALNGHVLVQLAD